MYMGDTRIGRYRRSSRIRDLNKKPPDHSARAIYRQSERRCIKQSLVENIPKGYSSVNFIVR